MRERLEAESRMDGELDESLVYPALPSIFSPLIDTMNNLSDYSYQEIKAYAEVTGIKLDWLDVGLLKDISMVKDSAASGRTVKEILGAFGWQE